ncbi:MAG: hypothetical protein AAF741_18745 [Bacteroidota bacterium]
MRILALATWFLLLPQTTALADCGGVSYGAYTYSFVKPDLLLESADQLDGLPRFGELYATEYENPAEARQDRNLQEWYERYCEQVLKRDISELLYGRTYNALVELRRFVRNPQSKANDLPQFLYRNSFARHLVRNKCTEVIDYLVYCKEVEPLVSIPESGRRPTPSKSAMEQQLEAGHKAFYASESHYVRLRYAYQIIRLAHYLKDYQRTIDLYDELIPETQADASILFYWIEAHRAGALQKLGNYAESAYLYSRVFDQCPSKRESSYLSFKIRSDEDWRQTLLFCQNEHERATLYVLRAQNPRAELVEEMRDIFRLQPGSIALEPLLVREIERLEKDFLGLSFNPQRGSNQRYDIPRPGAEEKLIDLQGFVREVIESGQAASPSLWALAEAYLYTLAGDFFFAEQAFGVVEEMEISDNLRLQLDSYRDVLSVLRLSEINDQTENQFFALLDDERLEEDPDLRKFIFDKFRALYLLDGQRAKAFLLRYELDELRFDLDRPLLNELLMLADSNRIADEGVRPEEDFDRQLLIARGGVNAENDLNDMLATYYLQRGQLEAAQEVFSRIPKEYQNDYGIYYPYLVQFTDRVNYRPIDTIRSYNKAQFFASMVDLEQDARRSLDPDESAKDYFVLGLAFYNMSYFSYNWRMADYFRSGTSAGRLLNGNRRDFTFSTLQSRFDNYENMSMDKALYYFEEARRMAEDPEIAARATYFAAKAERNIDYSNGLLGPTRNYTYFSILRDQYEDTQAYDRALAECKTFKWFVGGQ